MGVNRTNTEQFQLRLPPGLRDRIKAYAERHNRSINTEIVMLLEREFPEQWGVDDRMKQLGELLSVLRAGTADPRIDSFINDVQETIEGVISGRVKDVPADVREDVSKLWTTYQERVAEDSYYSSSEYDYDDEERRTAEQIGRPEKYVDPLPDREQPRWDHLYLSEILPAEALADLTSALRDADIPKAAKVVSELSKKDLLKKIEREKRRQRYEEPPAPFGVDPFASASDEDS